MLCVPAVLLLSKEKICTGAGGKNQYSAESNFSDLFLQNVNNLALFFLRLAIDFLLGFM